MERYAFTQNCYQVFFTLGTLKKKEKEKKAARVVRPSASFRFTWCIIAIVKPAQGVVGGMDSAL